MLSVQSSTNLQRYAQLQAMGVSIYIPLSSISVAEQAWLDDVCALLKIARTDCVFDATEPSFDVKTSKLHLPVTSYASEQVLKKTIWQNIRPFIN